MLPVLLTALTYFRRFYPTEFADFFGNRVNTRCFDLMIVRRAAIVFDARDDRE